MLETFRGCRPGDPCADAFFVALIDEILADIAKILNDRGVEFEVSF